MRWPRSMARRAGGGSQRIAVHASFDDLQRELRTPAQPPELVESAKLAARRVVGSTPVDAQDAQAVQQLAAFEVRALAQIEVELRSSGSNRSRSRRASDSRSRCSGIAGTSSGSAPISSPTISLSRTSARRAMSPAHSTASVASLTSDRLGCGRSRKAASASARRTDSTTWAGEASRSCSRSSRAADDSQRVRSPSVSHTWRYQAGDSTPAP